jgi:hypothetical protein
MTRRIRRDNPEYDAKMKEAKALFDEAMTRGPMRGRGRSSGAARTQTASGPVPAPVQDESTSNEA